MERMDLEKKLFYRRAKPVLVFGFSNRPLNICFSLLIYTVYFSSIIIYVEVEHMDQKFLVVVVV